MKRFWYNIVYVGNGATSFCSGKYHGIELRKKKNGGTGSLRYTVASCGLGTKITPPQLFIQEDAEFIGYFIRVKKDNTWMWYCTDGTWKDLETIVETKSIQQLFAAGERILLSQLKIKRKQKLYFTAQWRHKENQEKMDCGYWVFRNPLLAHALGKAENGKTYQNTRAVFERSYALGYRYFELDVALTKDKKLVCSHGWSKHHCEMCGMEYKPEFKHMTYDLFMQQKVNGNPVMDISELLTLMREYPDTYFEIDLHKKKYKEKIELLMEALEQDESLFDRLLIQAHGRLFYEINEVHHFLNVQMTVGENWLLDMDKLISFALEHGICAIAMRTELVQPKQVSMIRKAGIYFMTYTIDDDVKQALKLLDSGVNTICTEGVCYHDIPESYRASIG